LHVEDYGWYEIYKYEKWCDHELPEFKPGETFVPSVLNVEEGKTAPPKKMTEADLIAKMDENGIGTDATIHEHIKTVLDRGYVTKTNSTFDPTYLGVTLVECYEALGLTLHKPTLRAGMEADMKAVAEGKITKVDALSKCIKIMLSTFSKVASLSETMKNYLKLHLSNPGGNTEVSQNIQSPSQITETTNPTHSVSSGNLPPSNSGSTASSTEVNGTRLDVCPCKACKKGRMRIVISKKGMPFLGCNKFPECKTSAFFPRGINKVIVLDEICGICSANNNDNPAYLVKFEFLPEVQKDVESKTKKTTFCLNGCDDEDYKKLLTIRYMNPTEMQNNNGQYKKRQKGGKFGKPKRSKKQKCEKCGCIGAHPAGSLCSGKKKKTKKGKENDEEINIEDLEISENNE